MYITSDKLEDKIKTEIIRCEVLVVNGSRW